MWPIFCVDLFTWGLAVALITCSTAMSVPAVAQSNYTWQNAKLGGTGYVTGIIAHPRQQGLFYARTNVGGASGTVSNLVKSPGF